MDYNVLTLAYLGDSIYELFIRNYFIKNNLAKVNDLQKEVTKYVIDNNILTEEEMNIMRRARNHKASHSPKNTDIITYKWATSFEAILGYLYLTNQQTRLKNLLERSMNL